MFVPTLLVTLVAAQGSQTAYPGFVEVMKVKEPVSLHLIHAANYLVSIGERRAVDALLTYDKKHDFAESDFLYVLSRCIYEPKRVGGYFLEPAIGQIFPARPKNLSALPINPAMIQEGFPFNLIQGVTLAGMPELLGPQIGRIQYRGRFRAQPLIPTDDPLGLLDRLKARKQWPYADADPKDISGIVATLRRQITEVLRFTASSNPGIQKAVTDKSIHWDAARQYYIPRS